jgi:hypothetical protein
VHVTDTLDEDAYWLLDKNENNMIAAYNDFVDRIEAKIEAINQ